MNNEDAGQIPYMGEEIAQAQLEAAVMDQAKWLLLATSLRVAAKCIDDCHRKPNLKVAKTIIGFVRGQLDKVEGGHG